MTGEIDSNTCPLCGSFKEETDETCWKCQNDLNEAEQSLCARCGQPNETLGEIENAMHAECAKAKEEGR